MRVLAFNDNRRSTNVQGKLRLYLRCGVWGSVVLMLVALGTVEVGRRVGQRWTSWVVVPGTNLGTFKRRTECKSKEGSGGGNNIVLGSLNA